MPYDPDLLPPIGGELMLHYFKNPSHAKLSLICSRAPKKRREKLETCPSTGWGLHIEEGIILGRLLWLMFALFVIGSLLFAILWTVLEHDVSGAFGVASWILTVGALTAALVQTNFG